MLHCMQHIQCS